MEYYHISKKQAILKILIAICILGVGFGTFVVSYLAFDEIEKEEMSVVRGIRTSATIQQADRKEETTIQEKIEQINHAVVGISKLRNTESTIFRTESTSELGLGSGILVSEKGYILTNAHVAGEKYSNCYVTLDLGNQYKADVIWSDNNLDLAILKISGGLFPYAQIGNSEEIKIASEVYAIGNPIGYEFQKTVTKGIVSAKDRTIKFTENNQEIYMSNLIQTDATINPGNSGGPLINANGEVVGINTIKITSAEGIGFAVPINLVKPILAKLEQTNQFEEASLGIFAFDKNVLPYLEEELNWQAGIYVENVIAGSAAEKAGIFKKDVITHIDGKEMQKMCHLREYIYTKNPGDTITIKLLRRNTEKEISVTLEKKQ